MFFYTPLCIIYSTMAEKKIYFDHATGYYLLVRFILDQQPYDDQQPELYHRKKTWKEKDVKAWEEVYRVQGSNIKELRSCNS